jgi:SOS response regulatory protein OraA/RecX
MSRAGYSSTEIESTLAFLHERSYLNDSSFAREVARASADRKHWGPARIEQKLLALRFSREDIDQALSESFPEGEEEKAAKRALARFAKRAKEGGNAFRARAYRHLLGRGFSPEVARRLVSSRDFEDTGSS